MKTKRIIAIIIDHFAICFVGLPIFWIIVYIFNINNGTFYNNLMYILITPIYIFKDLLFKNASIGKKIMKLEIKNKDNKNPSIFSLIVRNITILIWPLEIILLILFNKRLGDMIFNTKVVQKEK